jgi:aminopeptidase-like protein
MSNEQGLADRGLSMHALMQTLFPICRSITGNGVRETLARLQTVVPLDVFEIASGTQVFDWIVPPEWNIHDAWIKGPNGQTIIDFQKHNLHVVNYSEPIHVRLGLPELQRHLHSLPDRPHAIPYRTTYYRRDWGFCLPHATREALPEGEYEVCIDAELKEGHLTYGELFLPGETKDEILISTHVCHPSMANDNLSGVVVATELAKWFSMQSTRKLGIRFLWIPGTIGAIAWISQHEQELHRIRHGLVLSGVGDAGPFHYKRSRRGDASIDRVVQRVLRSSGAGFHIQDFVPYGYDERQFCSPGFNLPVGCFSRSPYGTYPEYHTSDDNLEFVQPGNLAETFEVVSTVIATLQAEEYFHSTYPKCEPQLGKRGLYERMDEKSDAMGMFWILNLSDGSHSLQDIAERAALPIAQIERIAQTLLEHDLIHRKR